MCQLLKISSYVLTVIYIAEEMISSKIIPSFLTLKEGTTFLSKPLFNSLYAPFGSPSSGGQKPSGTRGCNRPPVLGTALL